MTGGVAAYAAHALARPQRAAAGTIYVELGGTNDATSPTTITNEDPNEIALRAVASGTGAGVQAVSGSGSGVQASSSAGSAVHATSTSGYGVFALSDSGRGIGASSTSNYAVYADNFSQSLPAIVGAGRSDATGVMGYSGTPLPPAGPVKTGVYGYAAQDVEASGVLGQSTIGSGVQGLATSGSGVYGSSTSGFGVYAASSSSGMALVAAGRVEFETSGHATVPVGFRAAVVTTGYNVRPVSRILCTLESDQGGLFIHRVTKDVAADSFRIVLSRVVAPGRTASVAWFVIG